METHCERGVVSGSMVLLLPCGEPLTPAQAQGDDDKAQQSDLQLVERVLLDPGIISANSAFLALSGAATPVVPASIRALYVHQGEEGSVGWHGQTRVTVLGSQSATTCVILVARCPVRRTAYTAHHDSATTSGCSTHPEALLSFLDHMQEPDIFLAGGHRCGAQAYRSVPCLGGGHAWGDAAHQARGWRGRHVLRKGGPPSAGSSAARLMQGVQRWRGTGGTAQCSARTSSAQRLCAVGGAPFR